MRKYFTLVILILVLIGCENRDINENDEFRPREILDNYSNSHFSLVTIDGIEYLIMERDNNNPHEGFGFMAFRANKLIQKQDSLMVYLKTMQYFQNKIYTKMENISSESGENEFNTVFQNYLLLENQKLQNLDKNNFIIDDKNKK